MDGKKHLTAVLNAYLLALLAYVAFVGFEYVAWRNERVASAIEKLNEPQDKILFVDTKAERELGQNIFDRHRSDSFKWTGTFIRINNFDYGPSSGVLWRFPMNGSLAGLVAWLETSERLSSKASINAQSGLLLDAIHDSRQLGGKRWAVDFPSLLSVQPVCEGIPIAQTKIPVSVVTSTSSSEADVKLEVDTDRANWPPLPITLILESAEYLDRYNLARFDSTCTIGKEVISSSTWNKIRDMSLVEAISTLRSGRDEFQLLGISFSKFSLSIFGIVILIVLQIAYWRTRVGLRNVGGNADPEHYLSIASSYLRTDTVIVIILTALGALASSAGLLFAVL